MTGKGRTTSPTPTSASWSSARSRSTQRPPPPPRWRAVSLPMIPPYTEAPPPPRWRAPHRTSAPRRLPRRPGCGRRSPPARVRLFLLTRWVGGRGGARSRLSGPAAAAQPSRGQLRLKALGGLGSGEQTQPRPSGLPGDLGPCVLRRRRRRAVLEGRLLWGCWTVPAAAAGSRATGGGRLLRMRWCADSRSRAACPAAAAAPRWWLDSAPWRTISNFGEAEGHGRLASLRDERHNGGGMAAGVRAPAVGSWAGGPRTGWLRRAGPQRSRDDWRND